MIGEAVESEIASGCASSHEQQIIAVEKLLALAILTAMRFFTALLCGWTLWGISSHAGTLAQFRTPVGDIEVELFDVSKPITVANFIRYVQSGAYENTIIHRWMPEFVIQGGGFYTANRQQTNNQITRIETFPEITNEYGAGRIFSNTYGTIAMARVGKQTNSATSQWFFNLTNNAFLDQVDGGFTVFGRVLRGTNVLNHFYSPTNNGVYKVSLTTPDFRLTDLPVLSMEPTYNDLVYVDVTLLSVQVARNAGGQQEISWQSVSNKINRIEFTTRFPPVWTELISTNGTGARLQITDPEPSPTNRFYRVRVDY